MIIDKEEIEVWMISLLECDRMTPVRERAIKSWEDQGIKVNLFAAYTPETIPNFLRLTHKNKLEKFGGPVPMTPTEKAIWYSHFYLWKEARERPICIVEEDCELIREFPEFMHINGLRCFCYNNVGELTSAGGYIISPEYAKIFHSISMNTELNYNVDHLLYKYADNIKPTELARQIKRDYRSIEHW